nr:type B 50S ribosomal protein L31 [Arthrobacter sp. zg-Y916]
MNPIVPGKIQSPKEGITVKSDIHPKYAPVVFRDLASDTAFLTNSTATSAKTIEWEDGNTYPLIEVEISSASHPFYTGKQRIMDSAGRVERFNARFKGFGGKK